VWSSAQPHNVRAMVETGFGRKWTEGVFDNVNSENASAGEKGEGRLLGVWARDKMDLNSNDYSESRITSQGPVLIVKIAKCRLSRTCAKS
jgi:hypothetical protein